MKTLAAILVETGKPLVLDEIEIPPLKPGQVLVKIAYSGICHTQLLECFGHRGEDKFLPHCLGHEGSGSIVEVGPGVTKVKAGDSAVLSWLKGKGADVPGTVYEWKGKKVNAGGITTFSDYAVMAENRLTPIPSGFSMRQAALLGCAIPTGFGSVINTAQVHPGESVAIFGTGGVGLCAVQAATFAGAAPIIAIDILESKLEAARALGATHCIRMTDQKQCLDEIKRICPEGLDHAIEASGRPEVMRLALEAVRPLGGSAVLIGNSRFGEILEIDPKQFNSGKRLLGTWGGDCLPDRDFPRFCKILRHHPNSLERVILSEDFSLTNINQAIEALAQGKAFRPIVKMNA